MVDLQTISIMIASASVVAGVIYYSLQIRNQIKARHTYLILRLYSTFGAKELQKAGNLVAKIKYKDYDDFVEKYGDVTSEKPVPLASTRLFYFLEEVGVLLQKRLVDIDMVEQLMGYNIMVIGRKTMPLIMEARKRFNEPHAYQNFEYLYIEMKKREQKGVKNG